METAQLVLRIFGVLLLGIVAGVMLKARRRDHVAIVGAGLSISVACFFVTSMRGVPAYLGALEYPLTAVCSTHPVWFWLFCSALFADGFKLRARHLACLVGMAIVGVTYQWMWGQAMAGHSVASHAMAGDSHTVFRGLGIIFGAAALTFICLGPATVFLGRRADLDERRRNIRAWFVPAVSIYLAVVVFTKLARVFAGRPTPPTLVLANLAIIDVVALAMLLTFLRIRVHNWLDFAGQPLPRRDELSRIEQQVLALLEKRFVPERLYRREGLTIAGLASLLRTQEHVLRRVINRGLGFRNFNDFMHSHRLREASARLQDPGQRNTPILTIALEAGYGSIGPFNRAFKERFGVTPGEYRPARWSLDERRAPAS